MRPIRELLPGFFERDPRESFRDEAETWRHATPEARDRAFDGLCELAAEAIASRSLEDRARVLGLEAPMSPSDEHRWLEIVRRERARRTQGQ